MQAATEGLINIAADAIRAIVETFSNYGSFSNSKNPDTDNNEHSKQQDTNITTDTTDKRIQKARMLTFAIYGLYASACFISCRVKLRPLWRRCKRPTTGVGDLI